MPGPPPNQATYLLRRFLTLMASIDHILNELRRQRHDLEKLLDDTSSSSLTTQELLGRIEQLRERSERVRQLAISDLQPMR